MLPLILASSSPYRRQLLNKLQLPYQHTSPSIDESPVNADETADELVSRLAYEKALALSGEFSQHLIIGSDQVASIEGLILTKPGSVDKAIEQLQLCRNKKVCFHTAVTLFNSSTHKSHHHLDHFWVHFKALTDTQIKNYITLEQPLDCAGSFKAEGLGISLFDALEGRDPNSLIGLPLIGLIELLNKEGVDPLDNQD